MVFVWYVVELVVSIVVVMLYCVGMLCGVLLIWMCMCLSVVVVGMRDLNMLGFCGCVKVCGGKGG